jgi:hypothetical protein
MMLGAEEGEMSHPLPNTPLLTITEVEAWRNELAQLVDELRTKNLRAAWLRRRLIAAQVLIDAQREAEGNSAKEE